MANSSTTLSSNHDEQSIDNLAHSAQTALDTFLQKVDEVPMIFETEAEKAIKATVDTVFDLAAERAEKRITLALHNSLEQLRQTVSDLERSMSQYRTVSVDHDPEFTRPQRLGGYQEP